MLPLNIRKTQRTLRIERWAGERGSGRKPSKTTKTRSEIMISETTNRVPKHTPKHLNERILDQTRKNLIFHGISPEAIESRLESLNREWDIERLLQANASTLVVVGVILGALVTPWFYILSFLVGVFLLQHAIQGWCPPIRLFRRLGFRTHAEIAAEHYGLRFLRGDFAQTSDVKKEADPKAAAEEAFRLFQW